MKRGLKIVGIVFGVLVAVLLILPFFINVDKFRPTLEAKVGAATNSTVKLGALSLGLIPSIRVSTQSVEITPKDPAYPESLIKGSDLRISIPLYGILFSPSATIELVKPEVFIVEKNGKYNFESLMEAKTPEEKASAAPSEEGSSSFIQKRIEAARLTLKMDEAKVVLKSQKANANLSIDELLLKNLGFNAPIEVKIISRVEYKDESGEFNGPFEFSGEIESSKSGDSVGADFDLVGDFSAMLIKMGSTFHKAEKVPLKFVLKGKYNKAATTNVKVSDLKLELASFKLAGKLDALGVGTDTGTVDFDLQNQSSKLEDIAALSPLLNDYKLQGNVSFYARAKGPLKNPALDIEFKADDLKGKTPKLSLPINQLNIKVKVQGTLEDPLFEIDPADLLIGKSDLKLRVSGRGKAAPDVKISLQSKSLDLAFLNSGKESKAASTGTDAEATQGKALDASMDEMAPGVEKSLKNPILDKAKVALNIDFKELKLEGAVLSNVKVVANYAARNLTLKDTSFAGYGGNLQMSGVSRLTPSAPSYDYTMKIQSIDLGRAISAHAPAWKGQMSGKLRGTARFAGTGLKKAQVEKSLHGGINGEILNGNTSLQLSKIVSGLMKQLPQRPDLKSAASEDKLKGKFKTLKMDSDIVGRKIAFKNIDIVFEPDEYNLGEVQYKASGTVTFDRMLELTGNVFMSPQVVKWPEAVGNSGKIEIPVKMSGPMDAAKPDINYTISKMGTRVLKKTAEKELKKGIQKVLEGQKPEDVLKNLFKMK